METYEKILKKKKEKIIKRSFNFTLKEENILLRLIK